FRAQFRIEAVGTDYQTVAIPLSSFRKVNAGDAGNGVLDTDAILQVVPVFGGIQGPEFSFAMDNLGFASSEFITADELPPSLAEAPLAFPNPTAGAASVTFALAEAGDVRADVFDVLGRRVATLADGPMAAGPVRLGVSTETFAPGTYVVRIATESGIASTRLTVVR
ncbi:MAG: T9SS type A sorting domain-containing protein, partial [Bacteroidota bacterium]